MSDKSWLTEIPQLDRYQLLEIRKTLDGAYRSFSREYGDNIEAFFDPLFSFLIWFEKLLLGTPWWIVIGVLAGFAFMAGRSWNLTVGVVFAFSLIGVFGMCDNSMRNYEYYFSLTYGGHWGGNTHWYCNGAIQ